MIKDLFAAKRQLFSFEVFPPKKDDDFAAVFDILHELKELSPDFISVTYGAGGSNSKKTVEIASYIQNECKIEALAHLTSVGFNDSELSQVCDELVNSNVHNILALRGDRPKTMTDDQYNKRNFTHATSMIQYLKDKSSNICIAGACYPEKHFESPTLEEDLMHLKEKTDAGADFLITQLFFDNQYFYDFREKAAALGIQIPISVGIMPITSAKQLGTTVSLSGSSVPKRLTDVIAKYGDSPSDMKKAGIDFAICQIQDLMLHNTDDIHIYTMNKPSIARDIMNAVR